MNKKNIKILIIVILSCILLVVFSQIGAKPLSKPLSKMGGISDVVSSVDQPSLSYKNIKASLFIEEKKYEVEIKEDANVFEVMQKLKEEKEPPDIFDFKYTEHTGLGIFINEINGKQGGREGYWIYYVNGEEAGVGVSNYKIKNGDIISWKYEK